MTESSFDQDAAAPGGGAVTVTLRSLDDAPFVLPLEAARLSEMCAQALPEDGAEEDVTSVEPIDILRVRKQALEKVVDYLKHYHEEPMIDIPDPLPHSTFEQVVTQQWYRDFCSDDNLPDSMLAEVLSAANYMAISPLLDLTCLKYTFALMGLSAEEIRRKLNLPELTPEELAKAREEHPWLFEAEEEAEG